MPYEIELGYSNHLQLYKKNIEKIEKSLKDNGIKSYALNIIENYFEDFLEIKEKLPRMGDAKGLNDITEIKALNNAYSMNIASKLTIGYDIKGEYEKDIAESIENTFLNKDKQNRAILYSLTDILIKEYISKKYDTPIEEFLKDIYETSSLRLSKTNNRRYKSILNKIEIKYKGKSISSCTEEYMIEKVSTGHKKENQKKENLEKIISDIRLKDIGGLNSAKKEIEKISLAYKHPEIYLKNDARMFTGILLHGPPGTGKTMIAKAIAGELDIEMYTISISDIVSKYFGDSEKLIKKYFKEIREREKAILFIDEIDALAPTRGKSDSMASDRIISTLLTEMDGIKDDKDLMVLGATNRLEAIDPALKRPGRFSKIIEVPLPDKKTREDIFRIKIKNSSKKENTKKDLYDKNIDYEFLADMTNNYSGADIEEILERVKEERAFFECKGKKTNSINTEDIIKEISKYERHEKNDIKINNLILADS
jgi:transitional endoplasmic reticulum ATPase